MKFTLALAALFVGAATAKPVEPRSLNSPPICWLLCASDEIRCPENWESHQEGDCWTCCLKNSDGQKSLLTQYL